MKTLILSAATGGDHLRASHATESYLLEGITDVEVRVVDALKTIHPILDKTIYEGYHLLATKTPKMFGLLYQKSNEENPLAQMMPKLNSLFSQRLLPLFEKYQPDVIIAAHPFAMEMASHLKEKGQVRVSLICIMAGYNPHKTWILDNVDAYMVLSEDMVPDMEVMGVRREIVYPFGIPAYNVFFDKTDEAALLEKPGVKHGQLTILITAGNFGVSNILQIYGDIVCLGLPFQIIIITGRDKKLFQAFGGKIEEYHLNPQMCCKHTWLVFSTNEVEKYTCAPDLITTRPGNPTVSEALACDVPLAVFNAIPGQEEDNADFLMSHSMVVRIRKGDDCAGMISELPNSHEKLEKMWQSCQDFDKSRSPRNILFLIYGLVGEQKEDTAAFGK